MIREWCSVIEGQDDKLTTLPLWINLVLPRELSTVEGVSYSANLFGVPLATDQLTAKMMKTKFSRVYVEVKANLHFQKQSLLTLSQELMK